jgi:shikimate dehydrogenase
MKLYGLIGNPVSHSLSEKYFSDKFTLLGIKARYQRFLVQNIEGFPKILDAYPALAGLNVTSPFKSSIIPYCHEIDEVADTIKAVNTIKISRDEDSCVLRGYNTDVDGFAIAAIPVLEGRTPDALILGSGGAARAVALALSRMGGQFRIVSRTEGKGNLTYSELSEEAIREHPLIINATPLGMPRHRNEWPDIPYRYIGSNHILFDLIYNPAVTPFLRKGKERGAKTSNGLVMLQAQAEKAWHIWNLEA